MSGVVSRGKSCRAVMYWRQGILKRSADFSAGTTRAVSAYRSFFPAGKPVFSPSLSVVPVTHTTADGRLIYHFVGPRRILFNSTYPLHVLDMHVGGSKPGLPCRQFLFDPFRRGRSLSRRIPGSSCCIALLMGNKRRDRTSKYTPGRSGHAAFSCRSSPTTTGPRRPPSLSACKL